MPPFKSKPPVNMSDRKEQVELIKSARKALKTTQYMPGDKEFQHSLGDEMVIWAKQETSEDIDEFFALKEIPALKFYRACENNAYLEECLSIAMSKIGLRLKNRVRTSHDYNMKQYPKYDSLSIKERRDKLEAEREQRTVTTYIEEKIEIPVFRKKDNAE